MFEHLTLAVDHKRPLPLTRHAMVRMQQRRIPKDALDAGLAFGREFQMRDAVIFVIGQREIEKYADVVDLSALNGLHVICGCEGTVITTYKDPKFHRKDFRKVRWPRRA
mgnify:CR=1 FL=1